MRLLTILASVAVLGHPSGAVAQPASRADGEFALGKTVGFCVQATCQIFHGWLATAAPKSGIPIAVKIDRWLAGPPFAAEVVEVPYEDPADRHLSGGRIGSAWEHVNTAAGTAVTVVYGVEKGLAVVPGEAVLVTSDEREMDLIRSLAEEESRLTAAPDLISEAVSSLSLNPNPALAGYIYMYLKIPKARIETDAWADLFSKLIQNPSVPPNRWNEIAVWLVSCYDNLSSGGRAALVSRLRRLGQEEDALAATVGVAGLAEIASRDASVEIRISQATVLKLRSSYAALVTNGSIYSNLLPLKAVLGIR